MRDELSVKMEVLLSMLSSPVRASPFIFDFVPAGRASCRARRVEKVGADWAAIVAEQKTLTIGGNGMCHKLTKNG